MIGIMTKSPVATLYKNDSWGEGELLALNNRDYIVAYDVTWQ